MSSFSPSSNTNWDTHNSLSNICHSPARWPESSRSLCCVLKYAQSVTVLCEVLRKYIPDKSLVTWPSAPTGATEKPPERTTMLRWGPCADSCQSEKHPEWTQNKKTSFFKKYYSSTKCNDHKLKALSSLAQYHNRFTRENKIGHPSFTLYIHLFSVHALAHREGSMVQVWKIFLGETNHLASCSLANGVCNFLYLQQKKNKVTQNHLPQIFKEAKLLKCGTSCNLFFYPVWNMSGLPKALNIHTWK